MSELAAVDHPITQRQLAGLYFKNLLKAEDEAIKQRKLERWVSCNPQVQEQVRLGLLQTLSSLAGDPASLATFGRTVAQAVGCLASVELPTRVWPSLLPTLLANVSDPNVSLDTKVASLEALGFTCEGLEVDDLDQVIKYRINFSINQF